jgi:hypothetical protein
MDHVRNMLVGNSKGFTVKLCIKIHLDRSFRILCIKIALLSFTEVTTFKVEFGLIHEDLRNTLRMELSSHLKS